MPSTAYAEESLILTAPPDQATFFSLPFVEELLQCVSWAMEGEKEEASARMGAAATRSAGNFPASACPPTTPELGSEACRLVRERLHNERLAEECYLLHSEAIWRANNTNNNDAMMDGPPNKSSPSGSMCRIASEERLAQQPQSPISLPSSISAFEGAVPMDANEAASTSARGLDVTPPSTLALLRIGVARALGVHLPARDRTEDDLILSRDRHSFVEHSYHHHHGGGACTSSCSMDHPDDLVRYPAELEPSVPECRPHTRYCYREESPEELQHTALVEWFEEVLQFARYHGFSSVQARCLLLNAVGLVESLYSLPDNITEPEVEAMVMHALQEAMTSQACLVPTVVLERQVRKVPQTKEIPDPEFSAAIEKKLSKEKLSKKQVAALKEQLAKAPLVTVHTIEEEVVEVEKQITVGPYFSITEAAALLQHLTSSIMMHWRLFFYLMCAPPAVLVKNTKRMMVIEDSSTVCLPPLRSFLATELYSTESERIQLWFEAEHTLREAFDELFDEPLQTLTMERDAAWIEDQHARERADVENRQNALSTSEYERVERAYVLRLNKHLESFDMSPLLRGPELPPTEEAPAAAVPEEAAANAAATPRPPSKSKRGSAASSRPSSRGAKTGGAKKGARAPSELLPLPPADAIELPPDTVFQMEQVEQRIEHAEMTIEQRLAAAATRKKRGKK